MNGGKNNQTSKPLSTCMKISKILWKEHNNGHSGAHTSNPSRWDMKRKWVKNLRTSLAIFKENLDYTRPFFKEKKWEKEKR